MKSINPPHRYGMRLCKALIAAAAAFVLSASAAAQAVKHIKLDLDGCTLYDAEAPAAIVRVTGDRPQGLVVGFHNVLVAPKVRLGTTFLLRGYGVSNGMNGVSLAIPSEAGAVNVIASGGTTILVVDTESLPEPDEIPPDLSGGGETDGGDLDDGFEPGEDLGELFSSRASKSSDYSQEQFTAGAFEAHQLANEGRYVLSLAGYEPQDVLVLTERLNVTPNMQMSYGEAKSGVNFHLGSSAGVVVKKSWLAEQDGKTGAIGFGAGTLSIFEKGAVILIADDDDDNSDGFGAVGGEGAVDGHVIFNVDEGARLEGVENLKFLVSQNGHASLMNFEMTADGLVLVQEPWRYEGPLSPVINALGDWAVQADAPRPLQEEFMRRLEAGEFGAAVNRIVAVMKGAGTSAEMLRTAENVVERTSRAIVAFEDDQAVRVTVRKGEPRPLSEREGARL